MSATPFLSPIAPLDVLACPLDGINLIEASAGTGKTWNICALYLRLLLERRLEVRSVLVVTFTNAATAELRSRIRARLVETLEYLQDAGTAPDPFVPALVEAVHRNAGTEPTQMAALLAAAIAGFDEAAIFTIHGFCQRALADTPFAAGLPFGLELIEDDAELRLEAVADFWRRRVAGASLEPLFAAWLAVRGDCPEDWTQLLARLQAKPLSRVLWPEDLDAASEPDTTALSEAFSTARALWQVSGEQATQAILDALPDLNANSYSADKLRQGARDWDAWLASGDFMGSAVAPDSKADLFRTGTLARRTRKNQEPPAHAFFDAAESLMALRDATRTRFERLRLRLLRDMAAEAGQRLRRIKRERRVLSFDDILFNAWDALCEGPQGWLAAALRQRYPAALIDEFQDTDPLQFAVFDTIYGASGNAGAGLFFVGDPKQAIYSFRNADLHTYLRARGRASRRHTLGDNQRSAPGLIAAVNALFGANAQAFILPGLEFAPARVGSKPRPTLVDRTEADTSALCIWRLPQDADGNYLLRDEARRLAVQATAAEVARLLREGAAGRISLDGRGLLPRDIAVLVRSHAQAALIKQALGTLGVGSVELSRDSIFESDDAEELERVLLAILEPGQHGRLLGAFATGLMGHDAANLLALSQDETALMQTAWRFASYREAWIGRGFGFMFRRWLDAEQVSRRLLGRSDGERRLTNLLHLGELLQAATRDHAAPDALMLWLGRQREAPAGLDEAQLRLESDRNLVQIVTIHKSKGLEYEVVFCPFLWDGHRARGNEGEGREYHDDAGDAVIDLRPDAADDEDIKRRRRREADAELVRLTYVALTRAAQRCYLVAGCYLSKSGRGEPSPLQSIRSLLNWLAAGGSTIYDEWADAKRAPREIEDALRHIAAAAAPHAVVTDLPRAAGEPLAQRATPAAALTAQPPPAQVPSGWSIGSYSSLQQGAVREAAAADHDARVALAQAGTPPDLESPAVRDDDILGFPRGPAAGDCLHAVFEYSDFGDSANWDAAITRALRLHPQPARGSGGEAALGRMLKGMLGDVVSATLPDGIVLKDVAAAHRLVELGFHLPAPQLGAARFNAWLKAHGYAMPRLAFGALEGYVKGYIDLVFAHQGRYYVADWKSNHLGLRPQDYGRERLAQAMFDHGYHLQYLIYSLVLHRHLGRRLPAYDYDQHFGGVLYLFVRGLRPGWVDEAGNACGVWFHRPDVAAITSLDALLRAQPEP